MQPTEVWLPIPGYPGYEASSLGRIRSVDRMITTKAGWSRINRGRVLRPALTGPYYHLMLTHETGEVRTVRVHALVCRAFHGEPTGDATYARHLNDLKLDNRAANLAWGTWSDNMLDAVANGHNYFARRTSCIRGHEFTPENTQWQTFKHKGNGRRRRVCRACKRERRTRSRN